MRTLLLLAALAPACGGGKADEPKAEPTKPDPTPDPTPRSGSSATSGSAKRPEPKPEATSTQPGLTVVMDGQPIAVRAVNAANYSDGEITVELRNFDQDCGWLTTASTTRSSQPTDLDVTLRLSRFLHPDGTLGWAVRGVYWHPSREKGSWTKQTEHVSGGDPLPEGLVIDAAAGKSFDLPLAVELEMDDEDLHKKRTLSIKGTAKATGCGDAKLKHDRELPAPQPDASITIAKQALPIRGAALAVKRDGSRELVLATGEVVCVEGTDYAAAKWPDVAIKLTWGPDGKAWSASREGRWVPEQGNADFGTLTATPNRPPGGAKEMTIKLAGQTTIGDYPVALRGKVKAAVCLPPK